MRVEDHQRKPGEEMALKVEKSTRGSSRLNEELLSGQGSTSVGVDRKVSFEQLDELARVLVREYREGEMSNRLAAEFRRGRSIGAVEANFYSDPSTRNGGLVDLVRDKCRSLPRFQPGDRYLEGKVLKVEMKFEVVDLPDGEDVQESQAEIPKELVVREVFGREAVIRSFYDSEGRLTKSVLGV